MSFPLATSQLGPPQKGLAEDLPNSEDEEPGTATGVHSATAFGEAEPAPEEIEEKQPEQGERAPVSFGEPASASEGGGTLSAGELADALRPAPLQSAQFGSGGFGSGGQSAHRETVLPQDSQRAQELNALSKQSAAELHGVRSAAELHGVRRSTVGRSQGDIQRQWGSQGQGQ